MTLDYTICVFFPNWIATNRTENTHDIKYYDTNWNELSTVHPFYHKCKSLYMCLGLVHLAQPHTRIWISKSVCVSVWLTRRHARNAHSFWCVTNVCCVCVCVCLVCVSCAIACVRFVSRRMHACIHKHCENAAMTMARVSALRLYLIGMHCVTTRRVALLVVVVVSVTLQQNHLSWRKIARAFFLECQATKMTTTQQRSS